MMRMPVVLLFTVSGMIASVCADTGWRTFEGDMDGWTASTSSDPYWNETFQVPVADGPYAIGRKFDEAFTPNGWMAERGMWTSAKYGDGLALQLSGRSSGSIEYVNDQMMPSGVDEVSFTARVGQIPSFANVSCFYGDTILGRTNYLFMTRVAMGDVNSNSFDGEGSVSLFGYYQPNLGCYEARVKACSKTEVCLWLYKWSFDGRRVSSRALGYSKFHVPMQALTASGMVYSSMSAGCLYIQCVTESDRTIVVAGVMNAAVRLEDQVSNKNFSCVKYEDVNGDRFRFGTFGFDSCNCPAQFFNGEVYDDCTGVLPPSSPWSSLPADEIAAGGYDRDFKFANSSAVRIVFPSSSMRLFGGYLAAMETGWFYDRGKFEYSGFAYMSDAWFKALTPTIPVLVQLRPSCGNVWKSVCDTQISGFMLKQYCVKVATTDSAYVKVKVPGTEQVDDVVLASVGFAQFCGTSYETDPAFSAESQQFGCPSNSVYFGGWVRRDNGETVIDLQPNRVKPGTLMGVRMPLMDGVGGRGLGLESCSFSYQDADANCRILVQVKEVGDTSELKAATVAASGWTTCDAIDFSVLSDAERKAGVHTTNIGLIGKKVVVRLVIDPEVVAAGNMGESGMYGMVTITDFCCTEAPELPMKVWGTGFEEFAIGESVDFGAHVDVSNDDSRDDVAIASYVSDGTSCYPGLLPFSFDSCGSNYFRIKTGFGSPVKIGANEMVGASWGEPMVGDGAGSAYVDMLVNMTAFDEEPEFDEMSARKSVMNDRPLNRVGGNVAISMRPRGFLLSLDDKLTLYAQEVYDEWWDEVLGTNFCLVVRGREVSTGSAIQQKHILRFSNGMGVPDFVDKWGRLTIQVQKKDDESVVCRIYANGILLQSTNGVRDFPLLMNSNDCSLYGVTFSGMGCVDDLVFVRGSPNFDNPAVSLIESANKEGGSVVVTGAARVPDIGLKTGVRLVVSPEVGEVLDEHSLKSRITALPTAEDQPSNCFKVKLAQADMGAVELSVALDEDVVKAEETLAEAVDANNLMELQALTAGEKSQISFENVRPGLYYALGVSSEISGLKTAVEQAPRVKATQDGVTLPIVKPEGSSVFMQMSVSDKK